MDTATGRQGDRVTATKFIQICASQNDLFALDEQGTVYKYNFTAEAWEKLVASRSQESPARSDPRTRPQRERQAR